MSLARNEKGAVALLAVFALFALIASVYYLTGLATAIESREAMQDGADAAAFSAAVVHARGMNVLALINIVMASLLAILVLLSMMASLFSGAAKLLAALSWIAFPLAAGVAPAQQASMTARNLERTMRPQVMQVLKVLDKSQEPIARAIPPLAAASAQQELGAHLSGHDAVVLTFPVLGSLPTRSGTFLSLCHRAGDMAADLVLKPVDWLVEQGLPEAAVGPVKAFLKRFASGTARAIARHICGVGGAPEPLRHRVEAGHPELDTPSSRLCSDETASIEDTKRACEQVEVELEASANAYDHAEGSCIARRHGAIGPSRAQELCESRRRKARRECRYSKDKSLKEWTWNERRYTHSFVLREEGEHEWVEELIDGQPAADDAPRGEERHGKRIGVAYGEPIPCAYRELRPFAGAPTLTRWNLDASEPLCSTPVERPTAEQLRHLPGQRYEVDVLEIVDVIDCKGSETIEVKVDSEPLGEAAMGSAPQEMCSCATPGCELFQLRSIVIKDSDTSEPAGEGIASMARSLGRFSFAQSEFYFDGDEPPSEWLWHMKWKARLRAFHLPPETPASCKDDDCPRASPLDLSVAAPILKRLDGAASAMVAH